MKKENWEYITLFGRVVAVHYRHESNGEFVLEAIVYRGTDIAPLLKDSGVWNFFEQKAKEQIEEFLSVRN